MAEQVAGLVLAAGQSVRMGRNKLLADLHGRQVVLHVVDTVEGSGCSPLVAVVSDSAVSELLPRHWEVIVNPDPGRGLASSLKLAIDALDGRHEVSAVLVTLGDQPLVGRAAVEALLHKWAEEPAGVLAAEYADGTWRPPVIMAREMWPALRRIEGDVGARALFGRGEAPRTVRVEGNPGDVDTDADLDRLRRAHH